MIFKNSLKVLAFSILASSLSYAASAQEGQTLRLALHSDIGSKNPGVNRDGPSDMVLAHVVEGLVAYGEDLTIKPMLAESWTSNPEATEYVFHLRKGVKFHNGSEMKAEDVVWNFKRYLNAETDFQCTGRYNGTIGAAIEDVSAADDYTVTVKFNAPAPNFLMTLATIQCTPWILHPSSVAVDGKFDKPVGTGPYLFNEWQTGRYVELKKFDDYSALAGDKDGYAGNKKALIPTLRFMTVPDASTRSNGLVAGDIDMIDEVDPTLIDTLTAKSMNVDIQQTPSWMTLHLQTNAPRLKDVRMRQAIAHAIDLTQLVGAVGEGRYVANPSIIPSESPYRDDSTATWPAYDVEKARTLLAEAGYNGEPISLLVSNRDDRVQVATIVQAMLNMAGINAQLEVRDWATQLDRYRRGDYEMEIFAYSARLDPLLMYQSLIGDKAQEPAHQWDDKEAIALRTKAANTQDFEERKKIYNELHQLAAKQVPIIGLFNLPTITALNPKVADYKGWPAGTHRLWGVSKKD